MKKSNKPYIVTNPEIEEMAKVIQKSFDDSYYGGYDPDAEITAEDLWNADYRKQAEGEWISVEERLPKEVEHIIVCDEDGTVGEAIFLKASRRFEWVDNEEIAFATHWMPLPEPPKMKGE